MQTNSLLNNPGSGGASNAPANPLANGSANADMFTKLLVAQIRNQDPLSPSDPAQFVQQLTQLAQTEALENLATLSKNNTSVLESMQVLSLGSQIGTDVMARVGEFKTDQDKVSGQFELKASSTKTTLVLTGVGGTEHKVELGGTEPGTVPFNVDPVALGLPAGTYKVRVETSSGEALTEVDVAGRVNSLRLSSTGVMVNISNIGEVLPGAITVFNGKPGASASASASKSKSTSSI